MEKIVRMTVSDPYNEMELALQDDKFIVGVIVPGFGDEAYLRDRDKLVGAQNAAEAREKYIAELSKYWLRRDEFRFVKVWNSFEAYKNEVGENARFNKHQFERAMQWELL